MAKKQMSREGFEKLQEEYTRLVTVRRAEVAQKLKEARAFGDTMKQKTNKLCLKRQLHRLKKLFPMLKL